MRIIKILAIVNITKIFFYILLILPVTKINSRGDDVLSVRTDRRSIKSKYFEIRQVTIQYMQKMSQTFEFLKDSNAYLKFKRMNKSIDENTYLIRLKSLVSMGVVYYYSLYEGFTRNVFKKVVAVDLRMDENEFDRRYPRLHDVNTKLIKKKYRIYVPEYIFQGLKGLRKARHSIVHQGKNARPDFDIVEMIYPVVLDYFSLIRNSIFQRKF